MQTVRDCGAISLKWGVYTTTFPARLRDICGRGGQKILRARGGDSKDKKFFSWYTYELTEIGTAQDLLMFKSHKVPVWRGGHGHKVSHLAKKLFAIESYWERQRQCPFSRVALECQPHARVGLMLGNSWPTQNDLHFFLMNVCLCVYMCLVWFCTGFIFLLKEY